MLEGTKIPFQEQESLCLNLQKKAFDSWRKEASWLTKNYGITFMSQIVGGNVDCHEHFVCPQSSGVHHGTSCLWRKKHQLWMTNHPIRRGTGLCPGLWNQNVKTFWLACAGLDLKRVEEGGEHEQQWPHARKAAACACVNDNFLLPTFLYPCSYVELVCARMNFCEEGQRKCTQKSPSAHAIFDLTE